MKKTKSSKLTVKERRSDDARFAELLDLINTCMDTANTVYKKLKLVNDNANRACDDLSELKSRVDKIAGRMGLWVIKVKFYYLYLELVHLYGI